MGGKSKQSQRTKNNAKPSSSSRSAELLNSGISLDTSVITLGGGKSLPPLFPTLATANLEQGLNPEFQICFKKLTKKDPVTRAKALQDLCELVNNGDVEDVVAALPTWAHYYRILTTDLDRKVREMTQVCQGAVVGACGRRTAPALRALLPAWLQAQYDDHAPAAAQARRALAVSILHCTHLCCHRYATLSTVLDDLVVHSKHFLMPSYPKIQNVEERELQMNRILASSLQGLQCFLVHLPPAHDDWLWAELEPLLQSAAFWKLADGCPAVRAAWLAGAGQLAARGGAAAGRARARRLLAAMLRAPPAAAPALWPALLMFLHHVPWVEGWAPALRRSDLFVVVSVAYVAGGWGDGRQLSNMLLPLLAHLPQDLVNKDFYEGFFNAVLAGLEKKNVLNSKSERQLWITTLSECLRYLSIQQYEYVLEVVTNVHRTWLARVLSTLHDGQTRTNLIKHSASCMTSLVKYWLKQSNEQKSEKYDQLVRNFWQNIGSTVLAQIDKSGDDVNEVIQLMEGHILLLQTLKTSFSQETKKQLNIKFDDEEPNVPVKSESAREPAPAAGDEARYRRSLQQLGTALAAAYLAAAARRLAPALLPPLLTLLLAFDAEDLFVALARQFDQPSVAAFYHNVLLGWLSEDDMRCEALVDIVFLMTKYMTEQEQDDMFDTFQQLAPEAVEWCVSVCVRHPQCGRRAARRWLAGPVVGAALRALAARAAPAAPAPPDRRAAALLLACVADAPTGELLVSESSVSDVVDIVCSALEAAPGDGGDALESCAMLGARLATAQPRRAARLALPLLLLNARLPLGAALSCGTWREVRSSWQDCGAALAPAARARWLPAPRAPCERCCTRTLAASHSALILLDRWGLFTRCVIAFRTSDRLLDATEIDNVLCLCPYLFKRCDEGDEPVDVAAVALFTQHLLPAAPARARLQYCALRYLAVTAQLNCIFDDDEIMAAIIKDAHATDVKDICKEDFLSYANEILLRAIYFRIMISHKSSSPDDDDTATDTSWCDELLADDYLLAGFCEVIYHYAVIETLHEAYAFVSIAAGTASAAGRRRVRAHATSVAVGRAPPAAGRAGRAAGRAGARAGRVAGAGAAARGAGAGAAGAGGRLLLGAGAARTAPPRARPGGLRRHLRGGGLHVWERIFPQLAGK
ncbi:hypothetical protein HF086_016764 [Spodoptera exigua]|uniref:E3 ubiquitin-protein ligase listerin n=1 Tax=Spodoptera exigua TaxID=7107 RepID=A0A922ML63_SPOEX|nr:hypothetical protein HF086_016764 [Spodoptera exigua]